MLVIKGRPDIDIEKDGQIYIYKKGGKLVKLQEDEKEGNIEIDVSDIFENATKWQWGIRTDKYWGVLLTAISFKVPNIILNVPNILVSIKKDKDLASINALVFAEDKDIAFKYANEFRRENRETVFFELSPDYYENYISISPSSLLDILTTLDEKVEQIKEDTKQVKDKTTQISEDTSQIKDAIEHLRKEFEEFRKEFFQFAEKVKTEEDTDKIIVRKINTKDGGIYDVEGNKVKVDILGDIFDYLDIDEKSFYLHFKVSLDKDQKDKVVELVKDKFYKGQSFLTKEDLSQLGIKAGTDKEWRIHLKIKDKQLKNVVSLLSGYFKGKDSLEKAIKQAINDAISRKTNLSFELIAKYLNEDERKILQKVAKVLEGTKELDKNVFLISDQMQDLLLKGVILQAEKQGKKVIIK